MGEVYWDVTYCLPSFLLQSALGPNKCTVMVELGFAMAARTSMSLEESNVLPTCFSQVQ